MALALGILALLILGVVIRLLCRIEKGSLFTDTETLYPMENPDAQAFPGTTDTRTVKEVHDFIEKARADNMARAVQQSNLGEPL